MSWQAFSWTEIHARTLPERLWPAISLSSARSYELVSFIALFLTPFAAMEGALGTWRLATDLGWAGEFFVNSGLLSHWQVWFAIAAFTQVTAVSLNRLLAKHAALLQNRKSR